MLDGLEVEFEGFGHYCDKIHVCLVWEVGLGDVDIESGSMEFGGGVADGMDATGHYVEGIAAGADWSE